MARIPTGSAAGNFAVTTNATFTLYTVPTSKNLELDYLMVNSIGSGLGAAKDALILADGNVIAILTAGNIVAQSFSRPKIVTTNLQIQTIGITAGTIYWAIDGNIV